MKPLFCMLIHEFVTHWWCCIELKHFSESKHPCSANSGYCLIFLIILSLYHWLFCHSREGCCFQPCCCLLGNRPVFYQVLLHMLGRSVFCFPCLKERSPTAYLHGWRSAAAAHWPSLCRAVRNDSLQSFQTQKYPRYLKEGKWAHHGACRPQHTTRSPITQLLWHTNPWPSS